MPACVFRQLQRRARHHRDPAGQRPVVAGHGLGDAAACGADPLEREDDMVKSEAVFAKTESK
jgi:hypothetical protein